MYSIWQRLRHCGSGAAEAGPMAPAHKMIVIRDLVNSRIASPYTTPHSSAEQVHMSQTRSRFFEQKHEPLVPFRVFLRRMLRSLGLAFFVVACALAAGILGYHTTEHLSWLDALLNASMILGGMGPVDQLHTTAGKWFASGYALFSGLVFVIVVGIVIAPILHRFFHWFHLESKKP